MFILKLICSVSVKQVRIKLNTYQMTNLPCDRGTEGLYLMKLEVLVGLSCLAKGYSNKNLFSQVCMPTQCCYFVVVELVL